MLKSVKTLLWKQWTDFSETWHVASVTKELQCVYKSWTWNDLGLLYDKITISHLCIWMGKTVKMSFWGEMVWWFMILRQFGSSEVSLPLPLYNIPFCYMTAENPVSWLAHSILINPNICLKTRPNWWKPDQTSSWRLIIWTVFLH